MVETVLDTQPTIARARATEGFDAHEFVIALTDPASGLRGYIAIHNRNLGLAHGGTRMKIYESEGQALSDALQLSRAMSYKSALAGLPYGGAKGVIMQEPGMNRRAVLRAYAQKIEALGGLFHTGTDVGLTDSDVRFMSRHTQYMLGVAADTSTSSLTTSKAAAKGVYYAMKAAAQHRFGNDKLQGLTIGIKGVGKLGAELADFVLSEGATLLVADVDPVPVQALQARYPAIKIVPAEVIHTIPMDIFAPCALGAEFTVDSIRELSCKVIAGGANNQLADATVGDNISDLGILYIPDYVANAGGLIFVSEGLEADGFQQLRVEKRLSHIKTVLEAIFDKSQSDNTPTHRTADRMAEKLIFGA